MRNNGPMQAAENSRNSTVFRAVISRSRVAHPAKTKATFTNSDGWMVMKPKLIQLRAPYRLSPKSRLAASSKMAQSPAAYRSFMVRSISRSTSPNIQNKTTPRTRAANCLSREAGAALAATHNPRVERKKAGSSTPSPSNRRSRKQIHSIATSPRKQAGSVQGSSSMSCSISDRQARS